MLNFSSAVDTDNLTYTVEVTTASGEQVFDKRDYAITEFFDTGGYLHRQPIRQKIIDDVWGALVKANK